MDSLFDKIATQVYIQFKYENVIQNEHSTSSAAIYS